MIAVCPIHGGLIARIHEPELAGAFDRESGGGTVQDQTNLYIRKHEVCMGPVIPDQNQ